MRRKNDRNSTTIAIGVGITVHRRSLEAQTDPIQRYTTTKELGGMGAGVGVELNIATRDHAFLRSINSLWQSYVDECDDWTHPNGST